MCGETADDRDVTVLACGVTVSVMRQQRSEWWVRQQNMGWCSELWAGLGIVVKAVHETRRG